MDATAVPLAGRGRSTHWLLPGSQRMAVPATVTAQTVPSGAAEIVFIVGAPGVRVIATMPAGALPPTRDTPLSRVFDTAVTEVLADLICSASSSGAAPASTPPKRRNTPAVNLSTAIGRNTHRSIRTGVVTTR